MNGEHSVAEALIAVLRDPNEITFRSATIVLRAQADPDQRRRLADVVLLSLELVDLEELADKFQIAAAQGRIRARSRRRMEAA